MDHIKLTTDLLSVDEITKAVTDPSCGAISLFVGTTRDTFEGQNVVRLEYEAYQEMAEKEIRKLCKQSRDKWSLQHIAVHHRLGLVPVAEASIILAVSSVHRRESLDAVSYLIDELKANVPIWKKEIYGDGHGNWKQNKECVWTKENGDPSVQEKSDNNNKRILEGNIKNNEPLVKKIKTEPEDLPGIPCNEVKEDVSCVVNGEEFVKKEDDLCVIDEEYVQITAPRVELNRRIRAFQQRKREELDVFNVQEFCTMPGSVTSLNSCARTSAVVLRSKDSNSHLKLTRVVNEYGPQTIGKDPGSLKSHIIKQGSGSNSSNSSREGSIERINTTANRVVGSLPCKTEPCDESQSEILPVGLDERLHNLEKHLKIGSNAPVPRDVYTRLKTVEDRVLHLEGISPEYFGEKKITIPEASFKKKEIKAVEGDLSLDEVSVRIHELKKKLKERQIKHAF